MSERILILACVSGFLDKFEKENVKILNKLGFCVHYAANMREQHYIFDPEEFQEMGITAHHIDIERSPYMFRNNSRALRQVISIIEENDIQTIHCHSPVGGVLGRLAGRYFKKRKSGFRVIYTAHGFHFYRGAPLINNTVYFFVEKWLARSTDILITINSEDFESAGKFRMKDGGRVYRIPGVGLDRGRFAPMTREERAAQRKKLGVGEDVFFLVSCGELNENKNQRIVLEALARMREEGKDISRIRYGICGEGFFHTRMDEWIREMRLEENVAMYGYCLDIRPILGCADASIFPSRREGLGMAGLESLSMGVPLIAADNRGTREYMVHKKNGYVCESGRAETVIKGIEFMLGLDSGRRKDMERFCRESVEKFDRKYTNKIMEQIYQGVREDGQTGKNKRDHGGI